MRKLTSIAFILLFSSSSLQAGGGGNPGMEEYDDIYDEGHRGITKLKEEMSTRISALEQSLENINTRNQQLIQDNTTLMTIVRDQLNPSNPLRAKFKHSNTGWKPYATSGWAPVTFDIFEGDERLRGNLSTIEIPEDGVYSLFAHYCWHANNSGSATAPYTAIAIDRPDNVENYFTHHHLAPNYQASDNINRITRLKRGDKVMVSIQGHPTAEYFLGHFQFDIEKLH